MFIPKLTPKDWKYITDKLGSVILAQDRLEKFYANTDDNTIMKNDIMSVVNTLTPEEAKGLENGHIKAIIDLQTKIYIDREKQMKENLNIALDFYNKYHPNFQPKNVKQQDFENLLTFFENSVEISQQFIDEYVSYMETSTWNTILDEYCKQYESTSISREDIATKLRPSFIEFMAQDPEYQSQLNALKKEVENNKSIVKKLSPPTKVLS